ncbi:hypothetical protein [Pseudoalteromonas rubra]|uniref:hypothetical protein n=1 Tax=Pseudoalteromonas rubra TaxID=43658 RepID=UPI000F796FAF|nr:hypothetical protein [Pseudoalteromonas rubra]
MFLLPLAPLISGSAVATRDIVTDAGSPAHLPLALPKAQCLSPRVSVQSDIDYRNAGSALFAPFSDSSVLTQRRDSRCYLSKEAVQMLHSDTITPLAEQQASRYGCPDGPQDVATGIARVLQAHPVN